MYVPHMYVCACRGQKREWDPLELELWIIVNLQMSAGKKNPGSLQEQQVKCS